MSISTSPARPDTRITDHANDTRTLLEDQWQRQVTDIVALSHDLPTTLADRDEASRRGELQVTARLIDAARLQLNETEAALARLDAGTYGRCVRCEEPIGPERLEVLPAARYCVACQGANPTGRRS